MLRFITAVLVAASLTSGVHAATNASVRPILIGIHAAEITADTTRERLRRDRFGMPAEGFVKLSLLTDDLLALQRSLAANGVEFVRQINESDRKPGNSWFMVSDPDGNLVQVFGPTPAVDPV
jgi:hypothetical protein